MSGDWSSDVCSSDLFPTSRYFYKGGLNCAESTLRCLIEDGVIAPPPEVVRMMTGFGGGMQRGTTCGAVVAAVAAIGWATGRTEPGQSREPCAAAVREFLRRFEETFGSLTCRELQAVYVKEHALKSEGMYRSCTVFVEKSSGAGSGHPWTGIAGIRKHRGSTTAAVFSAPHLTNWPKIDIVSKNNARNVHGFGEMRRDIHERERG